MGNDAGLIEDRELSKALARSRMLREDDMTNKSITSAIRAIDMGARRLPGVETRRNQRGAVARVN
jgi:hypothetical protein